MSVSSLTKTHAKSAVESADSRPSPTSRIFASTCTPTLGLGLLLFVTAFLPSYTGCNGKTIYIHEVVADDDFKIEQTYARFLMGWPYGFGLIVASGAAAMAWSGDLRRASALWWCLAAMIVFHAVVFSFAAVYFLQNNASSWEFDDFAATSCWTAATLFLVALLPITWRRCRDWYTAAMWIQMSLALAAAFCVSFLTPMMLLAKSRLLGGNLAVTASTFLIVATIVQRIDGRRSLTRRRGESPLQFNLKSMLLLMGAGGLATAWVGACWMVDQL